MLREFARRTTAQIWVIQVLEELGQECFQIVDGELMVVAIDGMPVCEDTPENIPMSSQLIH
ncbi:MAG: hypothetical protein AB1847_22470 [bacterium]